MLVQWCIMRSLSKVSIINNMNDPATHEVTRLLADWAKGNEQALGSPPLNIARSKRGLRRRTVIRTRQ